LGPVYFFKYLEQITSESAEKLKKSRSQYKEALMAMEKARMQEQMAKEKVEVVRLTTGLSENNFATALSAINPTTT
jgi:DNA-binding transcriptional regulator YiaG